MLYHRKVEWRYGNSEFAHEPVQNLRRPLPDGAAIDTGVALAQSQPDEDQDKASSDIVVTARKLDAARDSIQPALGANDITLNRATLDILPGGADRG